MKYVVTAAWDETLWIVESGNPDPSRIVGLMIEGEDVEWLQLENVDDGTGNLIPTLTVDEALKTQVLAQRLEDELAKNEEKAIKDALKEAKKSALNAFKDKNNKGASDIIEGLEAIIDYLKDRDGF